MLTTTAPSTTRPVRLALSHRFTRDDYHAMADAGILAEDDRVELIAGEVIAKIQIGLKHSAVVKRLNRIFSSFAEDYFIVSVQNPIALDDFNEPEPDITLLRPRADFYGKSLPGPADVLLIVEVADTSLAFDREEKIPLYALAGVPEVWIVNLMDRSLYVYRRLEQGEYQEITCYRADARISIPGLAEGKLNVNDLAF